MYDPSSPLSPSQIWRAVLGQLELQVSRPVFDTWLAGTRATSIDGTVLMVEAPNPFVVESIERRMYQTVLKSVQSVAGKDLDVRFYVSSVPDSQVSALNSPALEYPEGTPPPALNDRFTFASFTVGASNQLAVSAAQAVSEAPGSTYNPLFIYAPPGLGKTHLMHAIAHSSYLKGAKVRYITSEGFANEFIHGIRTKTTEDFRNSYRSVDILLVDDIQFLEGKPQTLEGFFHTINHLHTFQKQLVLASEKPPRKLTFLDDRLRSRLESGLVTHLQIPEPATKLSILQAKCKSLGIEADQEALEALSRIDVSSVRELEGAFTKAVAIATLQNCRITKSIASNALSNTSHLPAASGVSTITHQQVISSVLEYYGITHTDLTGRKRSQNLLSARNIAMHIMSSNLHLGVTEISKALGRDHSTVSLALKRISNTIPTNPSLQADLEAINAMLY